MLLYNSLSKIKKKQQQQDRKHILSKKLRYKLKFFEKFNLFYFKFTFKYIYNK